MEKSPAYLSEDILVDIFLRLPIKFVVRLRCVCKSWYRIISSSSFINSQRTSVPHPNNLYLLCEYPDLYTLICEDKSSDIDKICCYSPELFVKTKKLNDPARVHGSCKGLLCFSDKHLSRYSIIYLWNPVIRKAKRLPQIPKEGLEETGNASLCFGFFDDDYKVIRIACYQGNYRVGVYSLNTDSWKIIYCDSESGTFNANIYASSRCVGGVAYLVKYAGRIICFDMQDERIREVQLPENFDPNFRSNYSHSFFMEVCGESIGLVEFRDGVLAQWLLRYCGVNKSFSWEKKLAVDMKTSPVCYPLGFTYAGKYVIKCYDSNKFYLCDFEKSELRDFTMCHEKKRYLYALEYLAGSLALLNEETVDPFEETEPAACSAQTSIVFYKKRPRKKRRKMEILHEAQNKLKRKIEEI